MANVNAEECNSDIVQYGLNTSLFTIPQDQQEILLSQGRYCGVSEPSGQLRGRNYGTVLGDSEGMLFQDGQYSIQRILCRRYEKRRKKSRIFWSSTP